MAFDAHKNFAYSTVAVAPIPATSGTALTVASGQGSLFPAVPFNATVWPAGVQPSAANAEIVRVTLIVTDVLTITRAQESSSARTIVTGDQIANTVTAKVLIDIEVIDAAAGTGSLRTLGTAATAACAGNDSRLSDSRAPNGTAGGDLNGTYPNPSFDTGPFGGALWTTVTKTGDENATNSTLQADDELLFTAASGGVYEIELVIIYASPLSTTVPDLKIGLGEDTTARGVAACIGFSVTDATQLNSVLMTKTANTLNFGTAATNRVVRIFAHYVGAGGTFNLMWAQNTTDANPTTVRAGSILRYRRIV